MVNTEKIRQVVNLIEENIELYNQSLWAHRTECGTSMCIAGWTLVMDGWKPRFSTHDVTSTFVKGDQVEHVYHAAKEILGLSYNQADDIFHYTPYGWTPQEVLEMVKVQITQVTGVTFEEKDTC